MKAMTLGNLEMLCQLCGDEALARVILGTTNWGMVDINIGKKREQQLVKTFWNTMASSGSKSLHFDRTRNLLGPSWTLYSTDWNSVKMRSS